MARRSGFNIQRIKGRITDKLRQLPSRFITRKAANLALVSALSVNILATGLPALIAQYNDIQARTPHPLANADQQSAPGEPAADAKLNESKASPLPDDLRKQLDTERDAAIKGRKIDRRHVKKLNEHRTEFDTVYENADGTKALERSMDAVSYKGEDGNWKDIDNTLEQLPNQDWEVKSNVFKSRFGRIDKGITVTKDGQAFTMTPIGANKVDPVIIGEAPYQTVKYRNVWQGIDVEYDPRGSQLTERIIVKSRAAQTDFAFTTSGAGMTADGKQRGQFNLNGAFAGYNIATATVATMKQGIVGDAPFVTQAVDGNQITISLDKPWFKALATDEFPVIIDPPIVSYLQSSEFTNIRSDGYTCGSSCNNSTGSVGSYDWRFTYHAELPEGTLSGTYVTAAYLHLELPDQSGTYGTNTPYAVGAAHATCANVFTCIDGIYPESSGTIGWAGDIDMTLTYREAVLAGNDWGGRMMVLGDENQTYSYKQFDWTKTRATYYYDVLPTVSTVVQPANEGVVITSQPNLRSTTSTDSDGTNGEGIKYTYNIGTGTTGAYKPYDSIIAGSIVNSGKLSSPTWTVPDNILQDGTTYYWQVCASDGIGWCKYSPVYSFRVDLRQGKDDTQAYDSVGPVSVDLASGNLTTSAKSHSITALGGSLGINLDYNSPQRSRNGLVGEYFSDSGSHNFPSTPALLTRVEPNVGFDWAGGTPAPGVVPTDNFMARWTGYFVAPATATYQFGTSSDDGSRVTVNNTLMYDGWATNPFNPNNAYSTTTIALTAGQIVPIKYEYYEATGNASAGMLVKSTDGTTVTPQVIPTEWLQTGVRPVGSAKGLIGRYYTDTDTTNHTFPSAEDDATRLFLTRTDASMNFNWGDGAPVPGGPTDHFLVRWKGWFTPTVSDTYTFGRDSDDGARIIVDGTTLIDSMTSGGMSWTTTTKALTAGTPVPITVEYNENTGSARFKLLLKRAGAGEAVDPVIDPTTLSPRAEVLPDGWKLGIDADGNIQYDYAVIGPNSVVFKDSTGNSHEYKWTGSGYTPPINEAGHLVRNSDGSLTLQDSDGQTYVFGSDGFLRSSQTPLDDLHPAALQYTYGAPSGGGPVHLLQITDRVNTARWAKIAYTGDSTNTCPSTPPGTSAAPSGMICGVTTSDGQETKFGYNSSNQLIRLEHPGGEITDYSYVTSGTSCTGCLASIRDSLANDAIAAAVRAQDATLLTEMTYDDLGRVAGITQPAATASATRQAHTYNYYAKNGTTDAYTLQHVTGATEPNGYSRKVTSDTNLRTLSDFDVAGLETKTEWDVAADGTPRKDLKLSTIDPAGLRSTTKYDEDDRATDQYGPAPTAWFSTSTANQYQYASKATTYNVPTSTYTAQVPHTQTGYDENIAGLAAAYYEVKSAANISGAGNKLLWGNPLLHTTGIGASGGDNNKSWSSAPVTVTSGSGWGLRLTGAIHLSTNGTYYFPTASDDGLRLWIDDTLVVDDWLDGTLRNNPGTHAFINDKGDSWHRVRLDYYNKTATETDAHIDFNMILPGTSTIIGTGAYVTPRYGLTTSQKTFDSSSAVGDTTTTTSYGANPELGLAASSTLDPNATGYTGLNYTSSNGYETQGATGSYLRQTSKTLPGGTTTNYSHYAATDTADNPCTTGTTESYKQAGMIKLKTEADPDNNSGTTTPGVNAGRTTETIYDDAGRIVATRLNTDSWTCTTYDSRGRVTQTAVPAIGSAPARTITNNWAVSSNPFVVSTSDSAGTITTTSDLLGRTTSYTDANGNTTTTSYDSLGRLSTRSGPLGSEEFVYDNYNRLTTQKLDSVTVATVTYDSYGRISNVAYPTAGSLSQATTRDSLGRTTGLDYTLGNGTTHLSDSVTRSQSGQIISGTELGASKSYTYDKAGRLTAATIGSHTYAYSFGTPTGCTGTYNSNSGKNSNRTSQTIDSVTTNYCYDYADRLVSSSNSTVTSPVYDAHGNTTSLGSGTATTFGYDGSDRNTSITEGSKSTTFTRDAQNRIMKRVTTVTPTTTTLPQPWQTTNVAGSTVGTGTNSGSTYTITTNGYDLYNNGGASVDDQPQVVTQTLKGDGTIIARVTSQTNTDPWAKAGIIMRSDLTPGSDYAAAMITPSNGNRMEYNYNNDISGSTYTSGSAWLKLVRTGNTIVASRSSNGTSWTQIASRTITLNNTVHVGLFATSHSSSTNTAVFDNVSITKTTSLPSGWTNGDIGAPSTTGSASYSSGTYTVSGAGADIWDNGGSDPDDQFHYVYQTLTGDGSIVAKVKSQTNTDDWAKAGITLKASPQGLSDYVNLHTTPANGIRFQHGFDQDVDAGSYSFPNAWLKLTRQGNTVTGYKSTDGTTWTEVGSATVSMPTTITAGLIVSSVNAGSTSTATFDNVSVSQTTSADFRYGFTGTGDTPDFVKDPSGNIVEKYEQLPGGVLLTKRNTTSTFSLVNVHGDVMATTDAAGANQATFTYDPFGNPVSGAPVNSTTGSTFGWVGQHEKDTETQFTLAPTEMGARVYIASMGRFLQADPLEGGVQNSYVYPTDPINDFDLNGEFSFSNMFKAAGNFANKHQTAIKNTLAVAGLAACVIGAAICGAAAIGTAILSGTAAALGHYAKTGKALNSIGVGILAGGKDFTVGRITGRVAGARQAARYFGTVAGKKRYYTSIIKAVKKAPVRGRIYRQGFAAGLAWIF